MMNDLPLWGWLLTIAFAVAFIAGMVTFIDHQTKKRELNPPSKCILGYTMIRVGSTWVYQLKDNQQVPCK